MVTVELFLAEDDYIQAFQVEGHAGAAPYGEDIVCAAISILSQTAVVGLNHFLSLAPEVMIQEGLLRCTLPEKLNAEEKERAQVILNTMSLGLEALEPNYGKYFKIHKRRWTKC
ncbi:MAG: ribosomal-processing cysteine protease Prp [Clostridia bacterium]|jgi:uncharacterized protein YsxB (DUF464 family)|nr:ribosomal-processing cysteine protease Prp [Clostridia bacterium]